MLCGKRGEESSVLRKANCGVNCISSRKSQRATIPEHTIRQYEREMSNRVGNMLIIQYVY